MSAPLFEIDERWFEIVAQFETVVLTKHRESGSLDIWELTWKHTAEFPQGFETEAFERYAELWKEYLNQC